MAEFIQITTLVRKLFLPESVPWQSLIAEASLDKLRARYRFNELSYHANNPAGGIPPEIVSNKGEFAIGNDRVVVLDQFAVQPALLQFQITGDSDLADKFAADLGQFFFEIDPNCKYSASQMLIQTYQTIAIVKLSVPVEAMFSDKFSRFLNETLPVQITPEHTEIDLRLYNLRWIVTYRSETPDFVYLPKVLAIEPRQGSRPADMLYYTQSPSDFKGHKELVEAFEKALS